MPRFLEGQGLSVICPAMLLEDRVCCDWSGPKIAKAIIAKRCSYPSHRQSLTCQKPILGHDVVSLFIPWLSLEALRVGGRVRT